MSQSVSELPEQHRSLPLFCATLCVDCLTWCNQVSARAAAAVALGHAPGVAEDSLGFALTSAERKQFENQRASAACANEALLVSAHFWLCPSENREMDR